jgi:GT2 family glycosyltransferase
MSETVTAIVVAYNDPASTIEALESLLAQTLPPAELLVIDNDPAGSAVSAIAASPIADRVRTLHPGANLGYVLAVNLGAREARGDWLFFLNPDALAAPNCLERLLQAVDGPEVAVVGAQILLPDGRVNAGENPVNLAGVSWSGGYGEPREQGPPRDVAAVSGAALLARREPFLWAKGLCPHFFLYYDDTDLAWRMRMSGRRIRYCPEAVVSHDYEFQKGSHKWFHLERNREWALLSNLRLPTLLLLSPLLLATELVVLGRAFSEHWLREKLRAWASLARHSRALIRWRAFVQAQRNVSDYEVLSLSVAGLDTRLIDTRLPAWSGLLLEGYRRVVLAVLRSLEI